MGAKVSESSLATRYWKRPSQFAKGTSYKGCQFCKKQINPQEKIKPAYGTLQPAHYACVRIRVPAEVLDPPKKVVAPVVDKTKPGPVIVKPLVEVNPQKTYPAIGSEISMAPQAGSVQPNFSKLLEQAQENVRFSQQQLADAHKEIKGLRAERDNFLKDQTFYDQLIDECLKLTAAGQKTQSSQFVVERSAIKRVLILMQRWAP